jgi:hypothetical protein
MGCPECQDGLETEARRYGAAAVDADSESAHAREGENTTAKIATLTGVTEVHHG